MFDAQGLAEEIWRLRSARYRSAPTTIPDEFAEDVAQAVSNLLATPMQVGRPDPTTEFMGALDADIVLDGLSADEALLVFQGRHDRPEEIMKALAPFATAARIFDHLSDEHAAMVEICAGGITPLDLRKARAVFKDVAIKAGHALQGTVEP